MSTKATPRTDDNLVGDYDQFVYATIARELERELAEAREQRDRLLEVLKSRDTDRVYLDKKWNELRDQRDMLVEALAITENCITWKRPDEALPTIRKALAVVKGEKL